MRQPDNECRCYYGYIQHTIRTVVMCTACSASVFQAECTDTAAMDTSSPQGSPPRLSLVALKTKQSLARLGTSIDIMFLEP